MSHLAPTLLAFFTPRSGGSPNANEIDSLYKIVLYLAIVIFVGVVGVLCYALYKFRARRGRVAQQIHGNTRLELGWTAGAVGILVIIAIAMFLKLGAIVNPPDSGATGITLGADGESGRLYASATRHLPPNGKSLEITVVGRQFIWQYIYPGGAGDGLGAPYSFEEMVVPTETTVTLNVVSDDVVHSWWIPELGGKLQAVPGYHNYGWFKISKPGVYKGQCANICGRGHARMIATVRALPPAQFEEWLATQKRELSESEAAAASERAKLDAQRGTAQVENP
ncbi:MAG TPA: cytochrome c oxidase subunit II [Solirubrobacteraceae bacterium]|nr:cytochrome c oxidase subunit II [Solirubrobacteraceae bacterium]